jgi:hypothetical protein
MNTFPKPLYLIFKHIRATRDGPRNVPNQCWIPPVMSADFNVGNSESYYWYPGSSTVVSAPQISGMPIYKESSMFWCSECQGYIQVPYDCTKNNVQAKVKEHHYNDWRPLSFEHVEKDDGQYIDRAGHHADGCMHNTLGAPMPRHWATLLPPKNNLHGQSHVTGYSKLAGNLSVLFGLMAFSVPDRPIGETIQQHFRPGEKWGLSSQTPYGGALSNTFCCVD